MHYFDNMINNPRHQVALVTGSAKRIGNAIALALAKDGWDIAVHYRHSKQEAEHLVTRIINLGRHAVAIQCDLTNESKVCDLLVYASQLGQVGCIVNNASLFKYDHIHNFSFSSLTAHMHTNVAAPILLAQALYTLTTHKNRAVIINLLDQKLYNPNPDFLSYTLSKAALLHATTLLAQALAPRIRVVGIAPGITMTSGNQSDAEFILAHRATPLGKSSAPEDIAAAVCFVATAKAITGTTFLVDGGQHLIPRQRDAIFSAT